MEGNLRRGGEKDGTTIRKRGKLEQAPDRKLNKMTKVKNPPVHTRQIGANCLIWARRKVKAGTRPLFGKKTWCKEVVDVKCGTLKRL